MLSKVNYNEIFEHAKRIGKDDNIAKRMAYKVALDIARKNIYKCDLDRREALRRGQLFFQNPK